MSRHVLLNNIDHQHVRVHAGHGASLGDDIMTAATFPAEFRAVQAHYPIVFRETTDGALQPMALFGFREGQNLFLQADRWLADYVPLSVARQPFLIGRDAEDRPVIYIDLDHPRVSARGEALFREHGGTTPFLDRTNTMLLALHEGMQATPAFVNTLQEHELVQPFVMDIPLGGNDRLRVRGLHTIDEDRLTALDGAVVEQLHRSGALAHIYMVVASMSHVHGMIQRMSQTHAADA